MGIVPVPKCQDYVNVVGWIGGLVQTGLYCEPWWHFLCRRVLSVGLWQAWQLSVLRISSTTMRKAAWRLVWFQRMNCNHDRVNIVNPVGLGNSSSVCCTDVFCLFSWSRWVALIPPRPFFLWKNAMIQHTSMTKMLRLRLPNTFGLFLTKSHADPRGKWYGSKLVLPVAS